MSFRVIVSGHRNAIDGEFNRAVRRELEQLATSGSEGAPLASRTLHTLHDLTHALLLQRAPHECEVKIDLWGESDARGLGGMKLEVTITEPAADIAVPSPKEALLEERDGE